MYITLQKASCRNSDLLRKIITTPLSLLFSRDFIEISSASLVLLAFRSRTLYRAAVPTRVQSHLAFLSTLGLLGLAHLTQQRRFRNLGSVQQPSKNWTPNSFSFHPSDFDSTEFTSMPTRTSTLTVYSSINLLISDAVSLCDMCLKTFDFVLNEQETLA